MTRARAPKGTFARITQKPNNIPSSDYGDCDEEDLLAAAKEIEIAATKHKELLRSWVDAGIETAIRELDPPPPDPLPSSYATPKQPRSQHTSLYQTPYPTPPSSTASTTSKSTMSTPTGGYPRVGSSAHTLGPVDNLAMAVSNGVNIPLPPNAILHSATFLTFYLLVAMYGTVERKQFSGTMEYRAWISWLEQLGIDEMPYKNAWDHKGNVQFKANVEVAWSREPLEKRRVVEKMAVWVKHKSFVNLQAIPLRASIHQIPQLTTMPFHQLEKGYFFDIGSFANAGELIAKRRAWLSAIGFTVAVDLPLPECSEQTLWLNDAYAKLPILQRKSMEAHSKFLKLVAKPPVPSWRDLEVMYEIYPPSCFTSHLEYRTKRSQWLNSLRLDFWPFSYINTVEKYSEEAEVAWSEIDPTMRQQILGHAQFVKSGLFPYKDSWSTVEDIFGYTLGIDFGGDSVEYRKHRTIWMKTIGISDVWREKDVLDVRWKAMSQTSQRNILEKARTVREAFCKEIKALSEGNCCYY